MTLEVPNAVSVSQLKYYERLATNFNDSQTAPKTYKSIFKTFSSWYKDTIYTTVTSKL